MFLAVCVLYSSLLSSASPFSERNISAERHSIYELRESSSNRCSELSRNILCRSKNEKYCVLTVPDLKKIPV